ncbi:myelin-associated glycoprotein-like isoform X1 [Esox lucius]|uniref:Ig-like domain-containing protein n=2 Tax=Esox lucius TaxID=8010 RepID=A0A3P8YZX6_ESOLU|nr:myelin-associated glycoprotein-like isoform X1 [Esox lucius]
MIKLLGATGCWRGDMLDGSTYRASPENMFQIGLFMSGVLACFGQRNLITTMPERLDVLSGSCVQIPCSFHTPKYIFNSTINTSGVWIKETSKFGQNPDNVIFNSSKTVNSYQGNITGNLSQKNCTTVFFNVTTSYTNKYYFRIESEPYNATDNEKYVQIKVQDSPEQPDMTVLRDIKEGTPVSLNCSAVAPCPEHPPKLTWTLPTRSTPVNKLQENSDGTKSVLSTVTFIPSYLHNDRNITCTAVYPVGTGSKTAEHTWTLHVLFSPKNTSASISPAVPGSVGSCVNLTCSSTANPPVTNYTWFRISGGKTTQVASRRTYTLNVTVGDGGQYYCEARNDQGVEKSQEVKLPGQRNPEVWWIVGGTLVLVLLLIVIVFFGWRRKSKIPNGLERTVNPPETAPAREKPAEPVENLPEEIHYGEIDFSRQRPKKTQAAAQDRERDLGKESEYSEVKVTRGRSQDQEPLVNELYAQVNKTGAL